MLEKGLGSAIVVSLEWRMKRTEFIFEKIFSGSGIEL